MVKAICLKMGVLNWMGKSRCLTYVVSPVKAIRALL